MNPIESLFAWLIEDKRFPFRLIVTYALIFFLGLGVFYLIIWLAYALTGEKI